MSNKSFHNCDCDCRFITGAKFLDLMYKENLGITFEDDGEFWMSYKDFLKQFDQLEITNLTPDALDSHNAFKWEVSTFKAAWIAGETAGGCRNSIDTFAMNPQFLISLE